VHFNSSLPTTPSIVLEGTKHAEQVLSVKLLSRTETKGSTCNKSDPPGTRVVAAKPLPKEAPESIILTRELWSLVSMAAVIAIMEGDRTPEIQ
jgi:hypothetical protein